MEALLIGTGGARGWPEEGCRCASCQRARADGQDRQPGRVLIDGRLEFAPGQPGSRSPAAAGYQVTTVPGGFDVTGPDGGRLLLAASPGQVPEPPPDAVPYDLALLDLLGHPAQLGRLRSAGLVRAGTAVVALYADHRVSSAAELDRRGRLWRAIPGQDGQRIEVPAGAAAAGGWASAGAAARPHRTLIIGGARSGKSTEAELRLSAEPSVTYLAAGPFADHGAAGEADPEWTDRVAIHQARRPSWWRTVESLEVASLLRQETGALLIDGIGTWLAGVLAETGMWAADLAAQPAGAGPEPAGLLRDRIEDLITAWRQTSGLVVAVTDQVGSGLVPPYPAGRVFRDQLGWLNQRIAAESELNLQVVAGRVITLPG